MELEVRVCGSVSLLTLLLDALLLGCHCTNLATTSELSMDHAAAVNKFICL